MKVQAVSRLLLGLFFAAASSVADYAGAAGGNIAITFPTQGTTLIVGQSYSITWTATIPYYPVVALKLVPLTNGQPDPNNGITLSSFVSTGSLSYHWQAITGFSGGNVIQIAGLTTSAYSASFNIQAAPASSAPANSTMRPSSTVANLTASSSLPLNSTMHSATAPTTSSASLTSFASSVSSSSATLSSTPSGNSTDPNASSTTSDTSESFIAVGVVAGVVALAGVLYIGLRRTRRRRRPVSMPLMLEDAAEQKDWAPPDWTTHNNVPNYRKPQPVDLVPLAASGVPLAAGYGPSNVYSSTSSSAGFGSGYYPDPAVPWTSPTPQYSTAVPETGVAAAAVVAVPEEAYIREKTAVAVSWKEELEGVVADPDPEGLSKPHAAD